jgi:hypothetical protein
MDIFITLQDRSRPAVQEPRRPFDLRLTLGAAGTLLIVLLALTTPRPEIDAHPQAAMIATAQVPA